jgi:hypothetical protein
LVHRESNRSDRECAHRQMAVAQLQMQAMMASMRTAVQSEVERQIAAAAATMPDLVARGVRAALAEVEAAKLPLGSHAAYASHATALQRLAESPRAESSPGRSEQLLAASAFLNTECAAVVSTDEAARLSKHAEVIVKTATHVETLDVRLAKMEERLTELERDKFKMELRATGQYLELALLATSYRVPVDVLTGNMVGSVHDVQCLHTKTKAYPAMDKALLDTLADPAPLARMRAVLAPVEDALRSVRVEGNFVTHRDPAHDSATWASLFRHACAVMSDPDARRLVSAYVAARKAAAAGGFAATYPYLNADPEGLTVGGAGDGC